MPRPLTTPQLAALAKEALAAAGKTQVEAARDLHRSQASISNAVNPKPDEPFPDRLNSLRAEIIRRYTGLRVEQVSAWILHEVES